MYFINQFTVKTQTTLHIYAASPEPLQFIDRLDMNESTINPAPGSVRGKMYADDDENFTSTPATKKKIVSVQTPDSDSDQTVHTHIHINFERAQGFYNFFHAQLS